MASVSAALVRIKQDLHDYLPPATIEAACRDAGHRWRQRKLGPVATMELFILQILNFNTAISHLRHLADCSVSAGAYCRARQRLPLAAVQKILRLITDSLRSNHAHPDHPDAGRWRGHRTFLTDATGTLAPDVPALRRTFGQPPGQQIGCGYPVPTVLGLFDAFSGIVIEALTFALFVHEKSRVWLLHPLLEPGDLLVGDRAFCSFAHLVMLSERRVEALFRVHQSHIVSFRGPDDSSSGTPRTANTTTARAG
jgi:hypothetical protein